MLVYVLTCGDTRPSSANTTKLLGLECYNHFTDFVVDTISTLDLRSYPYSLAGHTHKYAQLPSDSNNLTIISTDKILLREEFNQSTSQSRYNNVQHKMSKNGRLYN